MKITFTTTVNVPNYVIDKLIDNGYKIQKTVFVKILKGNGYSMKQVASFTQNKRVRISYLEKQGSKYIEYDCEYFSFEEFRSKNASF